jgi:hypothetical protein
MQLNFFLAAAIAAIVPLIVGSIWYNPKVFGSAWMNVNGFNEEKLKEGFNMPLVFGLTLVFGYLISFVLSGLVIHQMGFFSMLQNHFKEEATLKIFTDVMTAYGSEFRTFKHGVLHGAIAAIGFAMPIIGINALFERRGFKYIAIHTGYWILTLMLMGGILCQFTDLNSLS